MTLTSLPCSPRWTEMGHHTALTETTSALSPVIDWWLLQACTLWSPQSARTPSKHFAGVSWASLPFWNFQSSWSMAGLESWRHIRGGFYDEHTLINDGVGISVILYTRLQFSEMEARNEVPIRKETCFFIFPKGAAHTCFQEGVLQCMGWGISYMWRYVIFVKG